MKITEVGRYKLSVTPEKFSVLCPMGTSKFSGLATSSLPKLYVASVAEKPIYVGITKQPMRNRLRLGWNATGDTGYYGYAWRHEFESVDLDIWCHEDPPDMKPCLDIETVEAELVFLIRKAGQWPAYQTEIHFHQSAPVHREAASRIGGKYGLAP